MSQIISWIALSAFAYALLILCVVLTYWTSQVVEGFVERSVQLYRLLLGAYPAAFRQEYGEAMVQLFRDTARDAYRRRGLLGLVAMWLRTLADFTISVIRQHRDRPVQVSSESVLLRDFLQKWRRLGSEALSVTAFSAWYGLHLLRLYFRRSLLVWATLTAIAFGTWFASFFDSFNWVREKETRVDLGGGTVQICHVANVGDPLSEEQWQRYIHNWLESNPGVAERFESKARPWEFSFFSDIPGGTVIQSRTIEDRPARGRRRDVRFEPVLTQPYKSWRLRFPFGILPVLLLGWTIRVYLRRKAGFVAGVQSA
ncbi:MAG TPA: hypothetical protein VMF69_25885 [Gemmataceae bacterium]|nr:hypothetical protein [Gemmataceae bacterium]